MSWFAAILARHQHFVGIVVRTTDKPAKMRIFIINPGVRQGLLAERI